MGKNIFFKVMCILIFSIVNCSCNTKEKTHTNKTLNAGAELPHIEIRPPGKNLPQLKLSEIADDIQYIKLETNDKCLLTYGLAYISENSEYIFIASGGIYQFNRDGKFIRKIGRQGQGPNEFTLRHLAIDFDKKIVYAFPLWKYKIVRFDFDGNPLGELKNEMIGLPALMRELNGQLLFVNEISQHLRKENKGGHMELYLYEPNSNKIINFLPNNYNFTYDKQMGSFYIKGREQLDVTKENSAYYNVAFSDTLYKIKDEKIEPFLLLDLGKRRFSHTDSQQPKAAIGARSRKAMKGKMMMLDMFAAKKHLMFNYAYFESDEKKPVFMVVYNMDTKEYKYYDSMILNDLDGGTNISLAELKNPVSLNISPDRLKNPEEETKKIFYKGHENLQLKFPERKDEFRNLMNRSKEDDNPIVVIIKLRDDF